MKNCVCAIGAFTGTNVRKVSLKNTDKITDARGMYANCPYLAVFPDIRFKNVKSVRGLAESGEWKDVFSGCATLHSLARRKKISGYGKDGAQKEAKFQAELEKIKDLPSDQYAVKRVELSRRIRGESIFDFDEMLEETRRFYEANWKSSEGIEIDENDMIVIRTARDAAESMAQFKNHAGVKVCMPDATRLFAESKLELKTLDMADVRSANEMFSGAKIIRLDNVINTEKLQNCDNMFRLAGVGFVPDMNLASV